jgi:hypothetical protein
VKTKPTRFVALFDLHYGMERKGRKLEAIHDPKALGAVLSFIADFKPQAVVLGGDMLDCGAISHHTRGKPRLTEGLRLLEDFRGLRASLITPLEASGASQLIYHIGNHEDWVNQLVDEYPGLEGVIDVESGLELGAGWQVVPRGGVSRLGKLHFIHGDQLRGGQNPARHAVETFERSIRFGHFHRASLHTKISALDVSDVRTGLGVPGLCRRDPGYGRGAPNGWAIGFLWGWVHKDGSFNDYLTFIVDGKFTANGKTYKG